MAVGRSSASIAALPRLSRRSIAGEPERDQMRVMSLSIRSQSSRPGSASSAKSVSRRASSSGLAASAVPAPSHNPAARRPAS